jgi:hypothetical protein
MKTIKSILISLLFIPILALAHEPVVLPSAGLTPESAFYFVDKIGEALREFFTFNPEAKAHLQIDFAAERIAEIKIILETKGVNAKGLEVAQSRLQKHLGDAAEIVIKQKGKGKDVSELAKRISEDFDANKEALKQVFKDQKRSIETKEDELKAKIREAQRAGDTAKVEALVSELGEIKAQKELLKLKEEEQEEALEQEEEKIEREMEKKEDAAKAIKEAEEERQEVLDEAAEDGVSVPAEAFEKFDKLLAQAKELFAKENYVGAKQLAKQAENALEKVEEAIEDLDEAKEEEEELKEEKEHKIKTSSEEKQAVRPGGCKTDEECAQYCKKNPAECKSWCKENPKQCPEEHLGQSPSPTQFASSVGPGGCVGIACQQYCQQNSKECQSWCKENPGNDICKLLSGEIMLEPGEGFHGQTAEIALPPKAVITYAKTVNFNADVFTTKDITKAKGLGANMITIWPRRLFNNDEYTFSFPEALAPMINFAHKNGLQVELRGSYGGDEPQNYAKYKISAIKYVADFAKFAEKYKVYRIVPFGEIDNNMLNHCSKITEIAQELLGEMRKHYSGKIGTGVVASWRDCGFTLKGYDYLTVSAYPQTQTGMDAWLTTEPDINLTSVVNWARNVADRSGISILHLGETGVQNIGEKDPTSFSFKTIEVSKEKEVEFYQKVFSLISAKVNGVAAFYNSGTTFMSINGDPAESVVKEWFGKL